MLFSFLLIAGCEKEEMSIIDLSTDSTPVRNKIPCTVANMQAAYANLQNNLTAEKYPVGEQKNAGYVVTTTHYYYRFLPADITEYETLVADEVLSVSDTPFELDIENTGENYFDPELEANGSPFTYYYSVTPIGYPLPSGIQADLLAELHFTPEDEVGENPTETELQVLDFYYDLNLEALKISENLKEGEKEELTYMDIDNPDPLQSKPYDEVITDGTPFGDVIIDFSDIETFEKRRRWTPSGRITVEEDELTKISPNNNILGVRNALVKVRKWGWLPIRRAETSKSGHFSTRSTRTRRVQYAVYFQPEDKRFVVKAGTVFWDARHRGTIRYDRQPWNQHFPFGAYRSHFYALVHNASADYTFEWATPQGYGLHPVRNGIRISAKFDATGSNWTGFLHHPQTWISPITVAFNALLLSETRVSRLAGDNDNSRYRGSHGIYATTIHELTHASHYKLDRNMWAAAGLLDQKQRDLIVESWAEGVETIITNDRYDFIAPGSNLDWNDFRQRLAVGPQNVSGTISNYTPLFIDLNDQVNQNAVFSSLTPRPPVDRVSNYTIRQMQTSLETSRTLVQLENRLRDNHNNLTESNLAELFLYPQAVLETLQD